jgi:hypothetical protein
LPRRGVDRLDVIASCSLVLGALLAGEALRARQGLGLALAHELHDIIGHALVAINVQAAAAARRERKAGRAEATALDEIASASADAPGDIGVGGDLGGVDAQRRPYFSDHQHHS